MNKKKYFNLTFLVFLLLTRIFVSVTMSGKLALISLVLAILKNLFLHPTLNLSFRLYKRIIFYLFCHPNTQPSHQRFLTFLICRFTPKSKNWTPFFSHPRRNNCNMSTSPQTVRNNVFGESPGNLRAPQSIPISSMECSSMVSVAAFCPWDLGSSPS